MSPEELLHQLVGLGLNVTGPYHRIRPGRPGQYFLVTQQPTDHQLAVTTHQSHDCEVNLMRINDCYLIYIGNHTGGTVRFPREGGPIRRVEWLAHTHPLENETRYDRVPRGPSNNDWRSLEQLHQRHPGRRISSRVIVCRGGRVVGPAHEFSLPGDPGGLPGSPGGLFTPDV